MFSDLSRGKKTDILKLSMGCVLKKRLDKVVDDDNDDVLKSLSI